MAAPYIQAGKFLFRAVRCERTPTNVKELSYPPPEKLTTFGRANRPGRPLFYCTNSQAAALKEVGVLPGSHCAVSRWRTKDRFLVSHVGYTDEVYRAARGSEEIPDWVTVEGCAWCDERSLLVERFLSDQFRKEVTAGNEHLYKISVAIAEKRFEQDMFEGLMYPTVAANAKADNLALKPQCADNRLEFAGAEYVRIDDIDEDAIPFKRINVAKALSSQGDILWLGRSLHWPLRGGQQLIFRVESGAWVARDLDGNIVEAE